MRTVTDIVHVTPVNDYREHEARYTCWCRPTEDPETPGLWLHNSLDQRELYETGKLQPQ